MTKLPCLLFYKNLGPWWNLPADTKRLFDHGEVLDDNVFAIFKSHVFLLAFVSVWFLLRVKKSLGRAQIGLLSCLKWKFPNSTTPPSFHMWALLPPEVLVRVLSAYYSSPSLLRLFLLSFNLNSLRYSGSEMFIVLNTRINILWRHWSSRL